VTAEGRIREFERMGWDPEVVPDPQDPATYKRSKLDWGELEVGRHARLLEVYRRLARLRREHPELTDPRFELTSCTADEDSRLFTIQRGSLLVAVNFGDESIEVAVAPGELLFTTPSGAELREGSLALPAHAGAVLRS
jgi:maltooligosyltrehalose trehalohydrolase